MCGVDCVDGERVEVGVIERYLAGELLAVGLELPLLSGNGLLGGGELAGELLLLRVDLVVFLSLAFPRVVGGQTVPLDTLDATLLLLVLGLGTLSRGEASLWLWEDLAPRLALLHRL